MSISFKDWQTSRNRAVPPSKRQQIETLFDEIEKAQAKGAKVCQLRDWLNQVYHLDLTENYLNNILYRIRKKRRGKSPPCPADSSIPQPVNNDETSHPPETPPEPPSENTTPYDLLLAQYHQCDNQVDKYVVLGGRREDIEDKNITTQRNMVMHLRNKLRQKHKGIY